MAEPITAPKTYVTVWGALMVATAVTVGAAFIDLRGFNPLVALAIATFKAIVVVLFFMHVRHSSRLTRLTLAAGLFWLAILMSLTMSDYLSRPWLSELAR